MAQLSRREVLGAGLALGFTPGIRLPQAEARFAYFSDTHVGLSRNIPENAAMIREIAQVVRPQFAVNVGDVVDYGWAGEFDQYVKLESQLGCPVHRVPGNHDVRWSPQGTKLFRERLGPTFQASEYAGLLWISLDSSVPLSHWGHYESDQMRWLDATLRRAGREVPILVSTHHWVGRDRVMVDNEDALLRALEPYNVKAVLTGHGHSDLQWTWNGMLALMNRGLYQGSYVSIVRDGETLEFARRTVEQPTLTLLARVSLKPEPRQRPLWQIPLTAKAGEVLAPVGNAREFRWGGGSYSPIPDGGIAAPTVPGDHTVHLRESEKGSVVPFVVRLESSESPLRVIWETELPGGVMSHLKIETLGLFVSMMDGSVSRVDAETGRVVWTAKTQGYCHSSPVVADGMVVVGSADAHVHCFDAQTGRSRWRFETKGPVYSSAAVTGGMVTIASGDGKVYGLDRTRGTLQWTFELPPSNTAFIQSPAATDGERVFLGAWDRNLYCLDAASGRELWRQLCTTRSFAFSAAIAGPAVRHGVVVAAANGNELHAFRSVDGAPLWRQTAPGDKFGHSTPRIVGGRVVAGGLGPKGEVHAVRLGDGAFLWTTPTGSEIYDSSPAVAMGRVAIGSVDGTLSVLDLLTGRLLAQRRIGVGHFLSSPAMQGNRIYAATFANRLVCLEYR